MRRAVGLGLALLGAALCVASACLGVRSFYVHDRWVYDSASNYTALVISKQGRFDLLYVAPWTPDEPGWTHFSRPADRTLGGTDYSRRFLGLGGGKQLNGGLFVNVPYWLPALLGAAVTAWVVRARRRAALIREGRCAVCGYDLRATPQRCPECGASTQDGSPGSAALRPGA